MITFLVPIPSLLFPWEQLDQPAQFVCIASACTSSTQPEKKKKPLCVLGNELFNKLRCSRWMILFFKKTSIWQKKKRTWWRQTVLIFDRFHSHCFYSAFPLFLPIWKNPCKRKKKAKNSVISRYYSWNLHIIFPLLSFLTLFVWSPKTSRLK